MHVYDEEAARARFLALGCSPEDADALVLAGIDPDIVGIHAPDAGAFARAAVFHDLWNPNFYLDNAGGDPEKAWQEWAKGSVEGVAGDEDDTDEQAGEDGGASAGEDADAGGIQGWARASISNVGPGEYSIELYDDLSVPGNDTPYMGTLRFSLTAVAPAVSGAEHDALVIKAATQQLTDHGYFPGPASEFRGGGDGFSVVVGVSEWAMQWLEDQRLEEQRSPAEKLDLLLAGLQDLHLDSLAVVHTDPDNSLIATLPEGEPDQPDKAQEDGAQASVVVSNDREEFLRRVAAERPATVYIERHQGGYAQRVQAWGDLEHPGLSDLKHARAEATQRDQELGGFTSTFRAGDSVHRYGARADWVQEWEEHLDALEDDVIAAREE
ncbi:hypothetical protein ACWGQ5_50350 [Streptomyces sp. NPDC055722]